MSRDKGITVCPICGQYINISTAKNKKSGSYMTKDHIYPKSVCKQVNIKQGICFRCNHLKRDMPPSALMYRILGVARFMETSLDWLTCDSIQISFYDTIQSTWTIKFKDGVIITIYYPGLVVKIKGKSESQINRIYSCKSCIFETIYSILKGPLFPKNKVSKRKSNKTTITLKVGG